MVSITVLFLESKTLIYIYCKTPIVTTRVPLLRKAIESHKTSSKLPWTQVQRWRKPTPMLTHFVTMCVVVPIASTHGRHSRRLERIKETRSCVVSLYRPRSHVKLKLLKFRSPSQPWLRQCSTYLSLSISYQFLLSQASIMTKFSKKAVMELSPLWLAMCKAKQGSLYEGKLKSSATYLSLNNNRSPPRQSIYVCQSFSFLSAHAYTKTSDIEPAWLVVFDP